MRKFYFAVFYIAKKSIQKDSDKTFIIKVQKLSFPLSTQKLQYSTFNVSQCHKSVEL